MTLKLGDVSTIFGLFATMAGGCAYVLSLKFVSKSELNGQLLDMRRSLDCLRDEVRELATMVHLLVDGRIRTGESCPPRRPA